MCKKNIETTSPARVDGWKVRRIKSGKSARGSTRTWKIPVFEQEFLCGLSQSDLPNYHTPANWYRWASEDGWCLRHLRCPLACSWFLFIVSVTLNTCAVTCYLHLHFRFLQIRHLYDSPWEGDSGSLLQLLGYLWLLLPTPSAASAPGESQHCYLFWPHPPQDIQSQLGFKEIT